MRFWLTFLINVALFFGIVHLGMLLHVHVLFRAIAFAILSHLIFSVVRESYGNYMMPDSHKTTCAKGSVPGANGLDCIIPTDIYGL